MFAKSKSESQRLIERELVHALKVLSTQTPGSDEYVKTLDGAVKIYELKDNKPSSVSKDTLATIGANLLGIGMILKHEWLNPITSKALNFVMRVK